MAVPRTTPQQWKLSAQLMAEGGSSTWVLGS